MTKIIKLSNLYHQNASKLILFCPNFGGLKKEHQQWIINVLLKLRNEFFLLDNKNTSAILFLPQNDL